MWNKEKIDYLHWIKFTRKLYQLQQPTQTPMKTNWNNANITDTHTHANRDRTGQTRKVTRVWWLAITRRKMASASHLVDGKLFYEKERESEKLYQKELDKLHPCISSRLLLMFFFGNRNIITIIVSPREGLSVLITVLSVTLLSENLLTWEL